MEKVLRIIEELQATSSKGKKESIIRNNLDNELFINTMKFLLNGFIKDGYNTRIFNPAGQDDIGGGCGQLWHVQEWMENYNNKEH